MAQRPITPPSPTASAPSARRLVVAPQSREKQARIEPIVASSQVASSMTAQIVPRQVTASESAPAAHRRVVPRTAQAREFILEGDEYLSPPPHVRLAELIGADLEAAAIEIRDDQYRRRMIEEVVRADACFIEGKYKRPRRRIYVEYKRALTSKPSIAFTETELRVPWPIIHYPQQDPYGKIAYVELTNSVWRTDHTIRDRTVRIMESGMMVQMRREQTCLDDGCLRDRYVYRPCDKKGNVIDFPLVGKISGELYDAERVDTPRPFTDITGEPIVMYDIKRFVCAFDLEWVDGTVINIVIVMDRARNVRTIVHVVPAPSDPDPELDRE